MLPSLPLDVLVTILFSLPVSRSNDIGALTLSACLQANSLLREAASFASIWKAHYLVRYEHSDQVKEQTRREMFRADWRLMYQARRRIDQLALQQLDRLISQKRSRQKMMGSIVDRSMDVWDLLEIETQHPIPWALDPNQSLDSSSKVQSHSLTRRYWAKCLLDTVSRGWAVEKWQFIASEHDQSNAASFEESMTSLSCFFGVSPTRVASEFDNLAHNCRQHMLSNKITIDPESPKYSLRDICIEICAFMFQNGFGRFVDDHFYFDILNNFPHAYLSTNKKTLPISLVHVFVAICTRLGIQASPVNFPGTVLAHVKSLDPAEQPIYINPSAVDHDVVVTTTSPVVTRFTNSPQTVVEFLEPCDGLPMLVRASRNILGMAVSRADGSPYIDHSAILVPLCTHMIFTSDRRTVASLLEMIKLDPPDIVFFQNYVLPQLVGSLRLLLWNYCQSILAQDNEAEAKVVSRHETLLVKYFVGMVFRHAKYGYLGVITGWDSACEGSPEWMAKMQIDTLRCGRHQPFYHAVADDGSERYVAEENIEPTSFSAQDARSIYAHARHISMHFEDVQLPTDPDKGVEHPEGRGRFLPNPHTRQTYPDDEVVATKWISEGSNL